MEFADLNAKIASLAERHRVRSSALARILDLDKTTCWRWMKNPEGLPTDKQERLVLALSEVLKASGVEVSVQHFQTNNLSDFTDKLGLSKSRTAGLSGVSLPIPDVLSDAARTPVKELLPFCGNYRVVWGVSGQSRFAQAVAAISDLPDGRVQFTMTCDGPDSFSVGGYLIRREAELHVIGDRVSLALATPRLFVMALEAEYYKGKVKQLRGYMPEYVGRHVECPSVIMVPCDAAEADRVLNAGECNLDQSSVTALVGADSMVFLGAAEAPLHIVATRG